MLSSIIDTAAEIRSFQGIAFSILSIIVPSSLIVVTITWDWRRRTKIKQAERRKEEKEREELLQALNELRAS